MELELLEGVFSRIKDIYTERPTVKPAVPLPDANIPKKAAEEYRAEFESSRDKFLAERAQILKHKSYRGKQATDSGYSSITQSGYSSHQGSKSPSPIPPDASRSNSDPRPRRWLVCQTGVVAVRLVNQEEADRSLEESVHELDVSRPDDIKQRTYKSRPPPPRRGVHWTHDDGDRARCSQQTARDQVVETRSSLVEPSATVLDTAKNSNKKEDKLMVGDKTLVNETTSACQTKKTSLHLNKNGTKHAEYSAHTGPDRGKGNAVAGQTSPVKEEQKEEELVCVELEESGEVIKVDSKFLEPACDQGEENVANLTELKTVSESQVVASITSRFHKGNYQTKLHTSLVSVNPMRRTDSGCGRSARTRRGRGGGSGGGEALVEQVEAVYRRAILSNQTQSIVMLGRSGAGKSCNLKQALAYLVETTQHPALSRFTLEKMHGVDCLLESFCSTRTSLNTHATRLVQLTEVQFDREGWLQGGAVEMALPDTSRLLRTGRLQGEPTFPILYQVQAALGKSNLFLPPRMLANNAFFTPLQDEVEIMTALEDWGRVCSAMDLLQFTQEEQDSFWIILAAITNLGYLARCLESGESVDEESVAKVAKLLGVKGEELRMVFSRANTPRTISPASSLAPSSCSSRTSSPSPSSPSQSIGLRGAMCPVQDTGCLAVDNVKRLAVNLYAELLSRLVSYINRSLKPTAKQPCNIFIFDSPGFQNPASAGDKPAAGFVDLCYNYLQEKLQNLFNTEKIEKIAKGKGAMKMLFTKRGTPAPVINVLDRQAPNKAISGSSTLGRRASKRVRFQNSAPGLFTLLHRAANCPWSDDDVFLQRFLAHWGAAGKGGLVERLGEEEFLLRHALGTNPVKYNVRGWRQISYAMGRTNLATELLRKSKREELVVRGSCLMYPGIRMDQTPLTLDQVKARMSCLQVQVQVDALVELLSRTEICFVFCMLPHNLAGLCELFKKSPGRHSNQKLIRDQVRGCQILDYLRALECQAAAGIFDGGKGDQHQVQPADVLHPQCVCRAQEDEARTGLAGELWHGLQLAVFNAVTNLDTIESAISSLTRTVSLPAQPFTQVLDETGLLLLQNGKLSLNLQGLID